MRISVLESSENEEPEWEPEGLPLVAELDRPPSPGHDDGHETDGGSRVIVIDLA